MAAGFVTHSNAKGCIRAKGVERDVAFEESDDPDHDAIAQAYRSEYARYRHQVALSCR